MEAWRPKGSSRIRPNARLGYAGAMFAELFGEVPHDVAAFLDTDRPTVYVALSSSRPEYLEKVQEAVEKLGVRTLIATTVHEVAPSAGSEILFRDFLPSHLVMPRCDLAIIHGGQGSVQTAIASGVPVIGFPLQPEQNFNLRQVERHGAGLCLSLRSLARGRLPTAIAAVLGDPGYRTAMQRLQRWQAARDGPLEVARTLTNLVSSMA
jgi:UDP:flavonoid glycosyltransferase YjiC (YdhE family)